MVFTICTVDNAYNACIWLWFNPIRLVFVINGCWIEVIVNISRYGYGIVIWPVDNMYISVDVKLAVILL